MTLIDCRKKIEEALVQAEFENPSLEAKWLIEKALQQKIIINPTYTPTSEEIARLQEWLSRRLKGEPLSRIKGMREFWSLPFHINEHTLDPRPETEHIIEGVLKWVKQQASLRGAAGDEAIHLNELKRPSHRKQTKGRHPRESGGPGQRLIAKQCIIPSFLRKELFFLGSYFRRNDASGVSSLLTSPPSAVRFDARDDNFKWRILDLGTGSGCILISLLHELKNATGIGIDLSLEAIDIARSNAVLNGVSDRATFTQGNWGAGLTGPFDIIVSNPPYILLSERASLEKGVLDFDPPSALFAGVDGLDCYRSIVHDAKRLLSSHGLVVLEFGEGQEHAVESIFTALGFQTVFILKDLAGIERIIGLTVSKTE